MWACLSIFDLAQQERDREAYARFKAWLYQADGVTVRLHRKVRNHEKVIARLQKTVKERADDLGGPTELEVDYTPA